jgi:hypothetical protein
MNDDIGLIENPMRNENAADAGHSQVGECRVDPTLIKLVETAQKGWWRFRAAELYVLAAGAPLLQFAEAQPKVFREYCGRVLGETNPPERVIDPARASLETLAFALLVSNDPDARTLTRSQRTEYASGLGWFAHLCPETDPDKAIALARSLGRLCGIATLYRKHKDEKDPRRQRRLARARATRGHALGDSGSTASPEVLAALTIDDAQSTRPEISLAGRDDSVTASAAPGSEEPAADSLRASGKYVAGERQAGAEPTEEVELPHAATNAAELAKAAIRRPELAQLLMSHLYVGHGIRPAKQLGPWMSDQRVLAWLQVNGMLFGPIRDPSTCAAITAQLVIERLQYLQQWGGQPWRL